MATTMTLTAAETSSEPAHPRRLLKKRNMPPGARDRAAAISPEGVAGP